MGTVVAICYDDAGESPPRLPVAVTVRFDSFSGPTVWAVQEEQGGKEQERERRTDER